MNTDSGAKDTNSIDAFGEKSNRDQLIVMTTFLVLLTHLKKMQVF